MTDLPPLPECVNWAGPSRLFTADQMRAYAAAERARWIGIVRTAEGWLRDAGMDDEAAQLERLTEHHL